MTENSLFNDYGKVSIDSAFKKIRTRKVKWTIPAHLKLALEQSIKKGNELFYAKNKIN